VIVRNGLNAMRITPRGQQPIVDGPGFSGVDSFRYAVDDDRGSSTGLAVGVVINVTPTPDPTTEPAMADGPSGR
jgi:hypothetical protein